MPAFYYLYIFKDCSKSDTRVLNISELLTDTRVLNIADFYGLSSLKLSKFTHLPAAAGPNMPNAILGSGLSAGYLVFCSSMFLINLQFSLKALYYIIINNYRISYFRVIRGLLHSPWKYQTRPSDWYRSFIFVQYILVSHSKTSKIIYI